VFAQLMRRWLALALIALCMSACAAPEQAPMPATESARLGLKLAPSELGESVSLQQRLRVEREGRIDDLDVALEVDPKRIEMVVLAFSQRVLALQYDGDKMTSWRHFMLPEQVKGEDVLQDLQLIMWPLDAIRKGLPAGWRIEDEGLRRTLSNGDGPVTVINYSNASSRWGGIVELQHLRYRYKLTIQSVSNAS
jgi:hypothetical protein